MASSKRERELARRRVERQAARRAEMEARRRRRRLLLIKIVAGAVAAAVAITLVVLNVDFSSSARTASCSYTAAGTASKPVTGLPTTKGVSTTKPKTATLATSRGTITIALLPGKAPCTVNSFAFLARQKYFDGTSCHRVTQGGLAVLQCGDPTGSGSGGPGYQFPDENLKGATYPKGTVAMANSGANTNGSQFFLVYADSQLDPKYTPFGTITSGLDVVAAVGKAGATGANPADGPPKLPIRLTTVTVS